MGYCTRATLATMCSPTALPALLLGAEKKARLHQERSGLQSPTKLQSSQENSGCMRPELG